MSRADDLAFRFVCVGVRQFSAWPGERRAAVAVILRNAVRLALAVLPRAEVGRVVLQTLEEPSRGSEAA